MSTPGLALPIATPPMRAAEDFADAAAAVARLQDLYAEATGFLRAAFHDVMSGKAAATRHRAFYPEIRLTTTTYAHVDSRLSFGHVVEPGTYATTVTRPELFGHYLRQQIGLLLENHGVPVRIGP